MTWPLYPFSVDLASYVVRVLYYVGIPTCTCRSSARDEQLLALRKELLVVSIINCYEFTGIYLFVLPSNCTGIANAVDLQVSTDDGRRTTDDGRAAVDLIRPSHFDTMAVS